MVCLFPFLGNGAWWYFKHLKDLIGLMRAKAFAGRGPFAELLQLRKKLEDAIGSVI